MVSWVQEAFWQSRLLVNLLVGCYPLSSHSRVAESRNANRLVDTILSADIPSPTDGYSMASVATVNRCHLQPEAFGLNALSVLFPDHQPSDHYVNTATGFCARSSEFPSLMLDFRECLMRYQG